MDNKRTTELPTRIWSEEEELSNLEQMMEQMAGMPREKLGERVPGEKCMYEKYTLDK